MKEGKEERKEGQGRAGQGRHNCVCDPFACAVRPSPRTKFERVSRRDLRAPVDVDVDGVERWKKVSFLLPSIPPLLAAARPRQAGRLGWLLLRCD